MVFEALLDGPLVQLACQTQFYARIGAFSSRPVEMRCVPIPLANVLGGIPGRPSDGMDLYDPHGR